MELEHEGKQLYGALNDGDRPPLPKEIKYFIFCSLLTFMLWRDNLC